MWKHSHIPQSEFGKILRGRRYEIGLKAEEVAKAVGVSRAYLSILETGRNPRTGKPSKPSLQVIAKLANTLRIDPGTLAEAAGYPSDLFPFAGTRDSHSRDSARIFASLIGKIENLHREAAGLALPFPSTPNQLPSGIRGLKLRADDHILLLTEAGSDRDFDLTLRFVVEGLKRDEGGVIRLPPSVSADGIEHRLRKYSGGRNLDRLVLVPWEQGVIPHYRAHRFSRKETVTAHAEDLRNVPETGEAIVRFATPDASDYFAWVENPDDVLEYEKAWPYDLQRIDPRKKFLLLCVYRMKDLAKQKRRNLSVTRMILRLLESHNRLVYQTSGDRLLFDRDGVRQLFSQFDLKQENPGIWNMMSTVGEKYGVWDDHTRP